MNNLKEKQKFNKNFLKSLNLENKKYYIISIYNYIWTMFRGNYSIYIYENNPLYYYITISPSISSNKLYKIFYKNRISSIIKSNIINDTFNCYNKGIPIKNLVI